MKKSSCPEKGFTLIELLIYLAIVGSVASGLILFSISISNTRSKNYVAQEVQANARVALDLISQRIRAATGVNTVSSTFGSDPGELSLTMAQAEKDPTIIDLNQDDGIIQITEGLSSPVSITSDEVKVTNLVFTNLTPSGTRENIRIEITVEYNTSPSNVIFSYSQSLQTAVSLRQ